MALKDERRRFGSSIYRTCSPIVCRTGNKQLTVNHMTTSTFTCIERKVASSVNYPNELFGLYLFARQKRKSFLWKIVTGDWNGFITIILNTKSSDYNQDNLPHQSATSKDIRCFSVLGLFLFGYLVEGCALLSTAQIWWNDYCKVSIVSMNEKIQKKRNRKTKSKNHLIPDLQ